jgi:hypothetical protein
VAETIQAGEPFAFQTKPRESKMSIFGSIVSKIFGSQEAAAATPATQSSTAATGTAASSTPQEAVDVEAVLTDLASSNSQQLNWRKSIVDLMKLLDLDSSLNARKELAGELGYTGDTRASPDWVESSKGDSHAR